MQITLFGKSPVSFDRAFEGCHRLELGHGAWVDYAPGWLQGHETLFVELERSVAWRTQERPMYDRVVRVPRLLARLPRDGALHPVLSSTADALSTRYRRDLRAISLALYRDGCDSVAMHGDRLRNTEDAVVAIVSLCGPRRFLLRRVGGGPARSFQLGWGDLLVMGGTCQQAFEHGIPKVSFANPRMAVMFREADRTGVSETGRRSRMS